MVINRGENYALYCHLWDINPYQEVGIKPNVLTLLTYYYDNFG